MVRYLSPEWFEQVRAASDPDTGRGAPDVVLRQVVTGAPGGEVTYQIELRGGRARLVEGATGDADMTFTSDYRTASAIAAGRLSTQAALLQGRVRVSGNPVNLAAHQAVLDPEARGDGALDAVPLPVRAETMY